MNSTSQFVKTIWHS